MTCEDVRQISGASDHCHSCHDDADEGYGPLNELEFQGEDVQVCCAVYETATAFQDAITRATPCYCDDIGRALCPKHRATG